jgi:hypothetical protein
MCRPGGARGGMCESTSSPSSRREMEASGDRSMEEGGKSSGRVETGTPGDSGNCARRNWLLVGSIARLTAWGTAYRE